MPDPSTRQLRGLDSGLFNRLRTVLHFLDGFFPEDFYCLPVSVQIFWENLYRLRLLSLRVKLHYESRLFLYIPLLILIHKSMATKRKLSSRTYQEKLDIINHAESHPGMKKKDLEKKKEKGQCFLISNLKH